MIAELIAEIIGEILVEKAVLDKTAKGNVDKSS